jgi:hypothetical protein
MKHRHQRFLKALAILSSATLLFVVLFPYTPTPIGLSIDKILFAVLSADVPVSLAIAPSAPRYDSQASTSLHYPASEILDLICLRLR